MAWIEVIPEEKATGKLAELYAALRSINRTERIANITAVTSLRPDVTESLHNLRGAIRSKGTLSVIRQEMVAVVTSAMNNCTY